MQLFKFELKKNWRKKKFLILSFLVIVFVAGLFYRNVWMQDEIAENALQNMITPHSEQVNNLEMSFREEVSDHPEDSNLQAQYENVLDMNDYFSNLSNALQNEQWEQVPDLEFQFLQTVAAHLESGGEFPSFDGEELSQRIEKNAILLEQQLPYEDASYSLTTTNFIQIAATVLMSFIGILLLVFVLGDALSEDFENRTIGTLYTQPLRKWTVLLGKYVSMMVGAIFFLFVLILTSLLLPLAFGEDIGSFSYPHLVMEEDGFTYISAMEYVGKLILLFIGATSFTFSLALLFSLLVRNRFTTLILTLLILIGGNLVTSQTDMLHTPLNPFYYFSFTELIERPATLGPFANVWLLFAYSFGVLFLCNLIQKKGWTIQVESPNVPPYRRGRTLQTSHGLKAMLLFEWRKLWRQGLIKQLLTVLALLVVGGYVLIIFQTNQSEREFIQTIEERINTHEETIIPWREGMLQDAREVMQELENKESLTDMEEEQFEIAQSSLSHFKTVLEHERFNTEQLKTMRAAYQVEDWKTYYDYWIYENRLLMGDIQVEGYAYHPEVSISTFNASIAEKELLAERNLKPVLPSTYIYTIYEPFEDLLAEAEWRRETQKVDTTGLFYLYTFFDLFVYLVPLGLLVFLLGSGFAAEKGKKRTLHLLETQPISKTKIFIGKTAVSITLALGIAFGLMACMVLLGTIGDRFGDWMFPVLHYDAPDIVDSVNYAGMASLEGGFHFITMGRYLIETGLLLLASLLFIMSLSLFFSLFTESTVATFILTTFAAAGGYFLTTMSSVSEFAHFLPFTYLNAGKITNGELATVLNNSSIQPLLGIGVLVASSALILSAGVMWFRKSGKQPPKTNAVE